MTGDARANDARANGLGCPRLALCGGTPKASLSCRNGFGHRTHPLRAMPPAVACLIAMFSSVVCWRELEWARSPLVIGHLVGCPSAARLQKLPWRLRAAPHDCWLAETVMALAGAPLSHAAARANSGKRLAESGSANPKSASRLFSLSRPCVLSRSPGAARGDPAASANGLRLGSPKNGRIVSARRTHSERRCRECRLPRRFGSFTPRFDKREKRPKRRVVLQLP